MENRPAPLRSRRVCRFCLTESEPLNYIYERDHSKPFQVPLTLQIMSCVSIEVYSADGMPQMICNMCRWNLDRSYKFKQQCKKADEALRAYPMTGTLPRPFPPITNDVTEGSNKRSGEQRSQSDQAKKARVDNGDRDRRERDRQIESSKKSDRNEMYKDDHTELSEGEGELVDEKEDRKLEPGEIRVHACDQCERTFPLRQALQLHVQRAHRDRNYKCTVCDRMFFSKYDLQKHMTTHSVEKPHICPICSKSFTRANLLQRHEKIHREDMRYACQHCDREFFSQEELEKHEDTSHKTAKPFQCNICNKRFTYKQGLERHEMLHSEDKTFTCEYCKEAFRTSTKLARHLTTHAGHRPFVCKLCPRNFLLSHHLTRHMRSHSVEKRHVCEDCGKAFKRKESLEVHQLTHSKRSSLGLTCDVCNESCRNRADYVTHIKQHIEAGEKMGPDGLQPDIKEKVETESEDEEEEEQYSDGDDDYEPPAYVIKKLPKAHKREARSEEDEEEEEEVEQEKGERSKSQVVFVRNKDGNIVKKTIKTLMPIQRRDAVETRTQLKTTSPTAQQSNFKVQQSQSKILDESPKARVDDTEAEVQKIVASVFKEHQIQLKQVNIPQEQVKDDNQTGRTQTTVQNIKEEIKTEPGSAKSINTVKVIKRIVVRKSAGSAETPAATPSTTTTTSTATVTAAAAAAATTTTSTTTTKEVEVPKSNTPAPSQKVTKRVIVRRIIRQGNTTREVMMNPDGTIIDPSELAKLPTGNVVKRVVVRKPKDQIPNTPVVQSLTEQQPSISENVKFELKTSQSSPPVVAEKKTDVKKSIPITPVTNEDQETKEKLERLENVVEQQRLKIEELQARKQQEYETIDEMLPERHDSEDEQELPLKRVFVKRKQSIYDEERAFNDNDAKSDEKDDSQVTENNDKSEEKESSEITIKKILNVKTEEPIGIEEMSRELNSILDSTDNVVKMQENVLSTLTKISGINEESSEVDAVTEEEGKAEEETVEMMQQDTNDDNEMERGETNVKIENLSQSIEGNQSMEMEIEQTEAAVQQSQPQEETAELALGQQDLNETSDIFDTSDASLCQKDGQTLDDSVIALSQTNTTINLNDTNDSQDSLEDKLSQMEG